MAARYVVDTNLLVYALDRREPEKHERAREVLRHVDGALALSGIADRRMQWSFLNYRRPSPREPPP